MGNFKLNSCIVINDNIDFVMIMYIIIVDIMGDILMCGCINNEILNYDIDMCGLLYVYWVKR